MPQANSLDEFWRHLDAERSLIKELPGERFDLESFLNDPVHGNNATGVWGGFVEDADCFDASFFGISPKEASFMDPQQRFGLEMVWHALEDAGIKASDIAGSNTGVYMGVCHWDYAELLEKHFALTDAYMPTGIAYAIIANRISHFFDFQGPSITNDTACAASMTSIYEAVRAIQNGECDMALAGGVNLIWSQNHFSAFSKAGMLSKSGKSQAFDAGADGYVRGEGGAVLLLKSLRQAEADGDNIQGVIRGIGVNHGGRTNSLTVTNPDAQAKLIQSVYRSADIEIDSVNYIEAHGPGTPLGDPIEVAGLKQAFSALYRDAGLPVEPETCGIGSVKTNIGHLEGAAGVAGIIKVLAALKYEKIPANFGFKAINPMIDLEGSPFRIQAEPSSWKKGKAPRRAGVSSFGFGGSNGHILIEGYDLPGTTDNVGADNGEYYVPLSAKNEDQLRVYASRLHAYLDQGRTAALDIANIAYTYQTGRESMDARVVFKVKNLDELHAALQCFAEGENSENILSPNNTSADDTAVREWLEGASSHFDRNTETSPCRISVPTYPFARERHWMDVFAARKDASSVPHPLLHRNVSNFDHIAFETTLRGDEPVWSDHHVGDDQVLPGTVYAEMIYSSVSIMRNDNKKRLSIQDMVILRPVIGNKGAVTLETRLKRLDETTISAEILRRNKSGETSTIVQASVKVSERTEIPPVSLSQIADDMPYAVSTKECYETLIKSGVHHGPLFQVLKQVKTDGKQVLAQLKLPRKMVASHKSLPVHPLLLDGAIQAWVGLNSERSRGAAVPFSCDEIEVYQPCEPEMWVHLRLSANGKTNASSLHLDIMLLNKKGIICVAMKNLVLRTMSNKTVTDNTLNNTVVAKPCWRQAIVPDSGLHKAANIRLFALGAVEKTLGSSAVDIGVACVPIPAVDYQDFSVAAYTCFSFLHSQLASWMQDKSPADTAFVLLLDDTIPDAVIDPLSALLKTAVLENPKIRASVIRCPQCISAHVLAEIIKAESSTSQGFREIRYTEQGHRYLRRFEMENAVKPPADLDLDPNAVYWITGGAGGLGQHFTEWLIAGGAKHILLTGRREAIPEVLQQKLDRYSAEGLSVLYRACDLSNIDDVAGVTAWCDSEIGAIKGIIHAAGVLDDGFIFNQHISALEKVFAPKVNGLVNLDQATSELDLDFMVLCSSVAASFGNSGQAFYAGANAFMDGFARHRNSLADTGDRTGKTFSIAWPLWADGGMSVDSATLAAMQARWGIQPLPSSIGLLALNGIIAKDADHTCTIMHGDVGAIGNFLNDFGADKAPVIKSDAPIAATSAGDVASDAALKKIAIEYLRDVFADVLQFEPEDLRVNRKLEEYGLESISIVEATNKLEEIFGPLSKTLLFEYVDIQGLAAYFTENHADTLSAQNGTSEISDAPQIMAETVQPITRAEARETKTSQPLASEDERDAHDIAVIGMSLKVSGADDQKTFWQMLRDGIDGFEPWPQSRWDHEAILHPDRDVLGKTVVKTGAFLDDIDKFDPRYFRISQAEAEIMSPEVRLFLEASVHAFEDAGYSREYMQKVYGGDVAVIMGSMTNEYHLYGFQNMLMRGSRASGSYTGTVPNMVSYYYGFTGPSYFLDTMCSASSTCVHEAVHMLRAGRCKMALAGGISLLLHPQKLIATSQEHFTTKTADVIRGYGVGADGTILGEGGGALVLKTLADAKRDGDQIYGVIKGTGISNAGVRNGFTVPSPQQQAKAIEDALEDANIDAASISYIEGHGSGTALGDPIEIKALTQVYGPRGLELQSCPVGTVKSNVAHLLAASGLAGLAKVLMQFKHKEIAPSLHSQELNPDIPFDRTPFYVPQQLSPWGSKTDESGHALPRRAGVTSIGAGGMNSHIILEEYAGDSVPPAATKQEDVLIALSAMNSDALNSVIDRFCDYLDEAFDVPLPDIAYTSQVGKNELPCRLTVVASSHNDAIMKLRTFRRNGEGAETIKFVKSILDQDPPDDDGMIENAITKRQLDIVAEIWTKGAPVDWVRFNEGRVHRRVSLPQYPFERVRCWYDDYPDAPSVINPLGSKLKYHPFVGKNTSSISGLSYETSLYLEEMRDYTYRAQNQSQITPIISAEVALAIGRIAGLENDISLEGLSVSSPDDYSRVSEIVYKLESISASSLQIHAIAAIDNQQKPWFNAVINAGKAPSHQPFDLHSALKNAREVVDHTSLYKAFMERGLSYGPYLETIDSVYELGCGRILAKLRRDPPQQDSFKKNVQINAAALAAAHQLLELASPDCWSAANWSMNAAYCAGDDIVFVLLTTNDNDTYSFAFVQENGLICASFDQVNLHEKVASETIQPDPVVTAVASANINPKTEGIAQQLKEIASAILKFPAADILTKEPFHDLGFDSITLTQYAQDINKALSVDISPAIFFDCAHIDALSQHLLDRHNPVLTGLAQNKQAKKNIVALEKTKLTTGPQKFMPINDLPFDKGDESVAVIGMAGRFPGADSVDDLFAHLIRGEDLIGDLPFSRYPGALHRRFDNANFVKRGGFVSGVDLFDAGYFKISPFEAQRLDPQQRLMLETVIHSLDDAGYGQSEMPKDTGVFVGVSALDYGALLRAAGAKVDGYSATGNSLAMVANRVSHFLDIQGASLAIDTACSSSLIALNQAVNAIKQGTCQMAIAGGVNLCLAPEGFEGPRDAGMLSPSGYCHSFGGAADGYVRGEGVVSIILKKYSDAVRDGDMIYGKIIGTAQNHGGHSGSLTAPNVQAQSALIEAAMGNINARSVSYIEAHGTGTQLGDAVEVSALKQAYETLLGQQAFDSPFVSLGSIKSNIGHLEAAAGLAGVVKVLLAMQHKKLPKSLHCNTVNPHLGLKNSPFSLVTETKPWTNGRDHHGNMVPLRAGVSSFGFGGGNAHVVLEQVSDTYKPTRSRRPATVFKRKSYWLPGDEAAMDTTPDLPVILCPKWVDKPLEAAGGVQAVRRVVLAVNLDVASTHATEVYPIKIEGGELADNYTAAAKHILKQLKNLIIHQAETPVFIQLVVPDIDQPDGYMSGLSAMIETAAAEEPRLQAQYVCCDRQFSPKALAEMLSAEAVSGDKSIRHVGGKRYTYAWRLAEINRVSRCDFSGVTLITGGMGGVGKSIATRIAEKAKDTTIILTGRTALTAANKSFLAALNERSVKAVYHQVDGADVFSVKALVDRIISEYGSLNHILHCAGTIKDDYILQKNQDDLEAVFSAKVSGTLALAQATEQIVLDSFVLFSSLAGITGNEGQVDYAAANGFMDAFAAASNGRILSVNWPYWQDGGMAMDDAGVERLYRQMGQRPMTISQGFDALEGLISAGLSRAAVIAGDDDKIQQYFTTHMQINHAASQACIIEDQIIDKRAQVSLLKLVRRSLRDLFAKVSGADGDDIEGDVLLEDYGIDSLMITKLNAELADVFGRLSKTLFFQFKTLNAVADYLVRDNGDACKKWVGLGANTEKTIVDIKQNNTFESRRARHVSIGTSANEPIAIIGISGQYPGCENLDQFWQTLITDKDVVTDIPQERWSMGGFYESNMEDAIEQGKSYTKKGAFLEKFADFDPFFFKISPRDAAAMDPQERWFLSSSWQAMENAGYSPQRLKERTKGQVGVFAGICKTGYALHGPYENEDGFTVRPTTSFASVANRVSHVLDLSGPSMPIDTMCSSSLTAIHEACAYLHRNNHAMAFAGGVNIYLHPSNYTELCASRMLSPDGVCKSFGDGANGFVPGEGVGCVLLKPLSAAMADGDYIHGVIRGSAVNHGGHNNGYTVPNPLAQRDVVRDAMRSAGVTAQDVSYIEAHGTGTALGDPVEIDGLTQAFAYDTDAKNFCAVGSVKSVFGHLEAAAGIAGLTRVLCQMHHGQLAPTRHAGIVNPNIDFDATPFVLQRTLQPWNIDKPRIAGISSFGAGGANAHIIIEEAPQRATAYNGQPRAQTEEVIVLSAKSNEGLAAQAKQLLVHLNNEQAVCSAVGEVASVVPAITHRLCDILNVAAPDIQTDDPLDTLGMEPHHWIMLERWLNETYQHSLQDEGLSAQSTVRDIAHAVNSEPQASGIEAVSLAQIAYTLQVGRAQMECRLGLTARTIEELQTKLRLWLDGQHTESKVIQCEDKSAAAAMKKMLGEDALASALINYWNQKDFEKFLPLWTAGISVNWERLPRAEGRQTVPLPTYPFDMQKFWLSAATNEQGHDNWASALAIASGDKALQDAEDRFETRVAALLNAILADIDSDKIIDQYKKWHTAAVALLTGESAVRPIQEAWDEWQSYEPLSTVNLSRTKLATIALSDLNSVLTGQKKATEVLFPDGNLAAVEAVYKENPIAARFSDHTAKSVASFVRDRIAKAPQSKIRILEIGAGTGGTSQLIFDALEPYENNIDCYCYTDVSRAFLIHADKQFSAQVPYLKTAILDIEKPSVGRGVDTDDYDLVIAANVLHATADIVETLKNVRQMVKPGGVLLLNETSKATLFTHITFGLLDGWWRFTDGQRRIPGTPSLTSSSWSEAMQQSGFKCIASSTAAEQALGQQIIAARADGNVKRLVVAATIPSGMSDKPRINHKTSGGDVEHALKVSLAQTLNMTPEKIHADQAFADLGLDSILGAEWVRSIRNALDIPFDQTLLYDSTNLQELTEFIEETWPEVRGKPIALSSADDGASGIAEAPQEHGIIGKPDHVRSKAAVSDDFVSIKKKPREPIAVVGMSGRFAGSETIDELWQHLIAGDDLVQPVTRFDLDEYYKGTPKGTYGNKGSFLKHVDSFDPVFFGISGIEATYMDPQQRLFLEEAWKTLEHAGHAGDDIVGSDCGVFVGCSHGDYQELFDGDVPGQAFWGNTSSLIPARISYWLDLKGPAVAIDTACSSSLVAVHTACRSIWDGECQMALAGGVFVQSGPRFFRSANQAQMLSPSGNCAAFGEMADGIVPGEAVAAVLLRPLSDAIADGDTIYGVIAGTGTNQDGATNGITAPSAKSQEKLIRKVQADFDIEPQSIGMIEAHGTGTPLGDPIEFNALNRVFGGVAQGSKSIFLGSVKSNIGHATTAAGICGLVRGLMSLHHGIVPPTLHAKKPNPAIALDDSPFILNDSAQKWPSVGGQKRRFAINSFGFSGTNAHLVVEEPPLSDAEAHVSAHDYLFVLSARTPDQLRQQVENFILYLPRHKDLRARDIAYTLMAGRRHFHHRIAVVADSPSELISKLSQWLTGASVEQVVNGIYDPQQRGTGIGDSDLVGDLVKTINKKITTASPCASELMQLADLFIEGFPLPHKDIFGERAKRVALPAYPLSNNSYWVRALPPTQPVSHADSQTEPINPTVATSFTKIKLTDPTKPAAEAAPVTANKVSLMPVSGFEVGTDNPKPTVYKTEKADGVFTISIGEGECLDLSHLHRVMESAEEQDDVGAVIIQGLERYRTAKSDANHRDVLHACKLPVIAVIADNMCGAGLSVALHADFVIVSSGTLLTLDLDRAGIRGLLLSQRFSKKSLEARPDSSAGVRAEILAEYGCGLKVVSADCVQDYALSLGRSVADAPRVSINALKQHMRHSLDMPLYDDCCAYENVLKRMIETAPRNVQDQSVTDSIIPLKTDLMQLSSTPDGVMTLQMKDTGSANSFTGLFMDGFEEAFAAINQQSDAKVVVLTGFDTYFAVGGTADGLKKLQEGETRFTDRKVYNLPLLCELPVIAAMQGHAVGAGWSMGMFADLVLFASEGVYHSNYMWFGFTPGAGATLALPQRLGDDLAREVLFSAQEYRGAELKERAPWLTVLPSKQVLSEAQNMAHALSCYSRDELIAAKKEQSERLSTSISSVLAQELAMHQTTFVGNKHVQDRIAEKFADTYIDSKTSHTAAVSNSSNDIRVHVIESLAKELMISAAEVREDMSFLDLGMDSILAVTWIRSLNEALGTDIAATAVYACPTVAAMIKKLEGASASVQTTPSGTEPPIRSAEGERPQQKHQRAKTTLLEPSIRERVVASLSEELMIDASEIRDEVSFLELGLDSILAVTWIRRLNGMLGLDLPATVVYACPNLGMVLETIAAAMPKTPPKDAKPPIEQRKKPTNDTPVASLPDTGSRQHEEAAAVAPTPLIEQASHSSRTPPAIAIIGASGAFPKAQTLDAFWQNLRGGVNCITTVEPDRWDIDTYYHPDQANPGTSYCKWVGRLDHIDEFDPYFFNITPREAALMDPQQRLFLQHAWHAIENAAIDPLAMAGEKCGVYASAGDSGYGALINDKNAYSLSGNSGSILAARISYFLDLRGPSMSIDTACSSSLVGISEACEALASGRCNTALVGGVNVMIGPDMFVDTSKVSMLSKTGQCYTFDQSADGFVPGEGIGVVMLKRLDDAVRDGDPIRAVIKGWGTNQDGRTNGITAPNPVAQAALMRDIYERFDIDPATIGLMECHGTGTPLGDPIEIEGLTDAFASIGAATKSCHLGSVKSNVGHLLAAAGVAGALKGMLALENKQKPPLIHFKSCNEHIDFSETPFEVNTALIDWKSAAITPRRVGVSSFGFSGTNAHIVMEQAPQRHVIEHSNMPLLFTLSAKTKDRLQAAIEGIFQFVQQDKGLDINAFAHSLQVGRSDFKERIAFVYQTFDELCANLRHALVSEQVDGIYRSNETQDSSSLFSDDNEMASLIEGWLRSSTTSGLKKLARLWVEGLSVNWRAVQHTTTRIAVPGYPFAHEKYWVKPGKNTEESTKSVVATSQSDPKPIADFSEQASIENMSVPVFLNGHSATIAALPETQAKQLPPLLLSELAREALQQTSGKSVKGLKHLLWGSPADASTLDNGLNIIISHDSEGRLFRIASKDDHGSPYHVAEEMREDELPERPEDILLTTIEKSSNQFLGAEQSEAWSARGLNIMDIHTDETSVLLRIKRNKVKESDENANLFDVQFLSAVSAAGVAANSALRGEAETGASAAIFSLEQLVSYGPLDDEVWLKVTPAAADGHTSNMTFYGSDGKALLLLKNLHMVPNGVSAPIMLDS